MRLKNLFSIKYKQRQKCVILWIKILIIKIIYIYISINSQQTFVFESEFNSFIDITNHYIKGLDMLNIKVKF